MGKISLLLVLLTVYSVSKNGIIPAAVAQGNGDKLIASEVKMVDDSVKTYLDSAAFFIRQEKGEEALKYYRKAAGLQRNNAEAYVGWINTSMQSGQTEEGMKAIDHWIKFNPENTRAWLYKAFLEAHMKHFETSLFAFEMLIKLQPEESGNWVGRGQMLMELKRYEEALDSFEKGSSMDSSGRTDVIGMKAAALSGLKRYDEALILINKLLVDFPAEASLIYNRACIFCLKGDKDNALNDLRRAIERDTSLKQYSKTDEDFKTLRNDDEFKKLTE